MGRLPKPTVGLRASAPAPAIAPPIVAALQDRIARGEQSLVFLNRRGYAPVLQCGECGWLSGCPHCSAWRVFHKQDRTLRCHHCGLADEYRPGEVGDAACVVPQQCDAHAPASLAAAALPAAPPRSSARSA